MATQMYKTKMSLPPRNGLRTVGSIQVLSFPSQDEIQFIFIGPKGAILSEVQMSTLDARSFCLALDYKLSE